ARARSVAADQSLFPLAALVEQADYAATGVSDDEAAEADVLARSIVHTVRSETTEWQRLAARLDPRPPETRGRPDGPRVRITVAQDF
ncbi:MAG: hypothetical protein ACRD0G_03780, partial [Acidimicrobiales bacterium]